MTKILLALGLYTMGVATGYVWRDRISQARRAKQREERRKGRPWRQEATKNSGILKEIKPQDPPPLK